MSTASNSAFRALADQTRREILGMLRGGPRTSGELASKFDSSWPTISRHLAVLAGKAVRRWHEGTLLPWALGRLRAWSEIPACRLHERRQQGLNGWPPISYKAKVVAHE